MLSHEVASRIIVHRIALVCSYVSATAECLFFYDVHRCTKRKKATLHTFFMRVPLAHIFFWKILSREISFEKFSVEWFQRPENLF